MYQSKRNILQSEKRLDGTPAGRTQPLVAVCYPNTYAVGMSNLAFQFLLQAFSRSAIRTERVFALPQARKHRAVTFESGEALSKATVILVTISYEDDLLNLIALLRAAAIPVRAAERAGRDPVVIAGGNGVSANPLVAAPVCDAVVLGEAADDLPLPHLVEQFARGALSRDAFLNLLAGEKNLFVPAVQGSALRSGWHSTGRSGTGYEPVASTIISPFSHFPDTVLIEINRSCVSSCRFCMASYLNKPFRIASRDSILELCERWRGTAKNIGLVGTAVTSYPKFELLCEEIRSMGFGIKVSSLRIEGMKRETLELISELGIRTITFAPESANERLRRCIGKNISDAELDHVLSLAAGLPFTRIKLYFMYGLPGEEPRDLERMVEIVRNMRNAFNNKKIEASINCLIPKAATPLQWHPLLPKDEIEGNRTLISGIMKRELRETPVLSSSAGIMFQTLLSLGDWTVGESIAGGEGSRAAVLRACRSSHPALDDLLHREKPAEYPFPWDAIDTGTAKEKLYDDYQRLKECVEREGEA